MTGRELIAAGYWQVSAAYRRVARLPAGKSGVQALAEASGRKEWAARLGERQAGDQYLRVYGKDALELTRDEWVDFKGQGGGTYYPPETTDERIQRVARSNGCNLLWADGMLGPAWHCGCADGLHRGDSQCSVISFESARRVRRVLMPSGGSGKR